MTLPKKCSNVVSKFPIKLRKFVFLVGYFGIEYGLRIEYGFPFRPSRPPFPSQQLRTRAQISCAHYQRVFSEGIFEKYSRDFSFFEAVVHPSFPSLLMRKKRKFFLRFVPFLLLLLLLPVQSPSPSAPTPLFLFIFKHQKIAAPVFGGR